MKPINKYCPRSGQIVAADALTIYKNFTVGFSNPLFRDDFRANNNHSAEDHKYFDILIKELGLERKNKTSLFKVYANLYDFSIIEKDRDLK